MAKTSWEDFDVYGRRNNKIIRYMESRLFKTKKDDPDAIVHYATAIGSLTRQNIEIIKLKDSYEEINSYFSVLKKDELAIDKHTMRQKEKNIQQAKQQMQFELSQEEIDRAKEAGKTVKKNKKQHEIEEEKSVRRQAEKMKSSGELKL